MSCAGPRTAEAATNGLEPLRPRPVPELPVTVEDRSGTSVTVTDARRILALDTYGTLASTVYALGLGDRLVGRDVSTELPALADLPVVTNDGHHLNAEAILALAPSVVLTDYSIGPVEVQLQLRDAGIPVVILDDERGRDTTAPQIEAVAAALGVPAAGKRLAATVDGEIRDAERRVAELARDRPRPRIAFLYLRGNAGVYQWFGKGSGADALIASLGGIDVATDAGVSGYRPLNAEGLAAAAPDLLLVMTDGLASVGGVDGMVALPGVAETPAGARRCVVDMADARILSFGPGYPAVVAALGEAIYGGSGS